MVDQITNIFYTDENVDGNAIEIARNLGIEIVTAKDAGLLGEEDPVHFAYAIENDYILVTGNIKHFEPLYTEVLKNFESHPGVLFITADHQKNSVLIANKLKEVSAKDLTYQAVWV